jgi:hypothetical protein
LYFTPSDNHRSGPFLLGSLLVLAVALFMSGSELLYQTRGQSVQGEITGVDERRETYWDHNGYRRHRTKYFFRVVYPDANGRRQSTELSGSKSRHHSGQRVALQIVPGYPAMVRFAEQSGPWPYILLAGSLLALVGSAIWMGVEINRSYARSDEDRNGSVVPRPVRRKKLPAPKPLKPIDDE